VHLLLGLLVLTLRASVVRAADDVAVWLERPLSPGSVVVLLDFMELPEAQVRWREALKSDDADVRGAAGRALHAAALPDLVPDLAAALAVEKDVPVATELIRAISASGTAEQDGGLLEAASRFPTLRPLVGNLIGRRRGLSALGLLARFRTIDDDEEGRRALVRAAARGGREGLTEAGRVVLEQEDPAGWAAIWDAAHLCGRIDPALVVASVQAKEPRIRALTYWFLAAELAMGKLGRTTCQDLRAAIDRIPVQKPLPISLDAVYWERQAAFAQELFKRAKGRKPVEDLVWARTLPMRAPVMRPWPLPGPTGAVSRYLTAAERAALVKNDFLSARTAGDPSFISERESFALGPRPYRPPVAPREFPKGYAVGVSAILGCDAKSAGMIGAEVDYDVAGRPSTVVVDDVKAAPECVRAGRLLLRSSFFSPYINSVESTGQQPEPAHEHVRLVLDPDLMPEVTTAPEQIEFARGIPPGGGPKGLVYLEFVIGTRGGVSNVQVIRGLSKERDAAAITLVSQWRFKPALRDGVAVATLASGRVSFR
jgi:TonB family protein